MKYQIKTLNKISPQGLKLFDGRYEVSEGHADPHAILVRSAQVDTDVFPNLLAVARAGAGVNNITVDRATARGIAVFNTPGANANAVAELVFTVLGLAARNIHESLRFTGGLCGLADDAAISKQVEDHKSRFVGFELQGKTLGVIGLGKIGVLVANAGIERGMRVLGYDPYPSIANIHHLSAEVEIARSIDQVLRAADVLSAHVPLSAGTKNLLGASQLQKTKPGVILINYARAGIFDDAAVLEALRADRVQAYLTDFPKKALLDHPRILCTPHLGASTAESEENCAVMAVREIQGYLEFGVVANAVNLPPVEIFPQESTRTRLVVINRDVPNMIADITRVLGAARVNIQGLVNESNGTQGYNLIDLEAALDDTLAAEIARISDVIRVRVLRF